MKKWILFFLIFFETFSKHLYIFIYLFNEKIKIKIKGPGLVNIIFNGFYQLPDRIYNSRNELITERQYQITIDNLEETIIMEWDNKLTSLYKMFLQLENIIEIDFSQFDSSIVTEMSQMFEGCSNVKKIDFTNFQTS